jgi:Na+/proline symporter/signal transduction histidine kinase
MSLPMNSWLVIGVLAIYIATLFACAFFGEKYAGRLSNRYRVLLFSLTLGVYCSSWTFYGAVGEAVRGGIAFLPIYLGPLLFLWLGHNIWRRLGRIRSHQPISSIADFIAARYGKSGALAALVTILAVIAVLPYLALQLRAIALSAGVLLGEQENVTHTTNGVLLLTALLAGIAMLFGTRQLSSKEQHGGLMLAIAFESAVKLLALLAVSAFALFLHADSWHMVKQDMQDTIASIQQIGVPASFWTQTLLAAMAMICLPRQFHVAVVELRDERHIKGARVWFSLYLLLMVAAIIPIASWALHMPAAFLPNADMAVLMLPVLHGQTWLALMAFIGGFSAATGMLLVATLALSIMLSNDLILPVLWRFGILKEQNERMYRWLKIIRRLCIMGVMLLGFWVYQLLSDMNQLSAMGLLAFSAVIQFAPALLGGLYWRGGSRQGVIAGLIAGFAVWGYTLFLPAILRSLSAGQDWAQQWLQHGPWGISVLQPEALFGFGAAHSLTHGVIWSLGLNLILFIVISKRQPPSITEQMQAEAFFLHASSTPTQAVMSSDSNHSKFSDMSVFEQSTVRLSIGDLAALAARINGTAHTEQAFSQFAAQQGLTYHKAAAANTQWWRFTEQLLAGVIGTASARTLLTTALVNNGISVGQVANILDQASQWQRFNQNLLVSMINHMTQGVSVVNANMQLVAWNKRYLELFDYPEDFVYVGCPVENLIRYNAERGECGPGDVEEHIKKRIEWMQAGSAHEFERQRADGRMIEISGHPIAGGGFVTTYADITVFRKTEALLEARVQERTQQLEKALQAQQSARELADLANMSKSRFVAAASHDLLQPMHAARLFAATLEHADLPEQEQHTLQQLDRSLHGAETILTALLDIARLDTNTLKPSINSFALNDLLQDLCLQYLPTAQQRHLKLSVHPTQFWVQSDPLLLRRMVQNLLSNALRYTAKGRVVVGVLSSASKPQHIRLGIWDTGLGISPEQQAILFGEFQRGGHQSPWGEQGLGLGLAIVDRMAKRLGHALIHTSTVGKGSCFMLELPITAPPSKINMTQTASSYALAPLNVLCVDNDATILEAMQLLLHKWGCRVFLAKDPQQAAELLQQQPIHVMLVDQHLDADIEGLDFLLSCTQQIPAALITADSDPNLPQKVKQAGFTLLKKPLKPAGLRAFLSTIKV